LQVPCSNLTHVIGAIADLEARVDQLVGVLDRNLPRGVPEVDECGLAEIGNSKKETHGTQF
jgi:hypothetical protein